MKTDIRVLEMEPIFGEQVLRTPLKFGAGQVKECTSLKVRAKVENRAGNVAEGWGQILLGVQWAFPSPELSYAQRDEAMQELARRICRAVADEHGFHHPIDLFFEFKPQLVQLAGEVTRDISLGVEIPPLAALVCGSPVDAALHDAFGIVNRIPAHAGYGPAFMSHDLSAYLGPEFRGRFVADYIRDRYQPNLPIFHLVGGVDKLLEGEVDASDPQDGLPVSLEAWIERDELFCFKVKLRGTDIDWDVERTVAVARVAEEVLARRGPRPFFISTDANELCEDPEAVIEYLRRLEEASTLAFRSVLYVEQPTERDLSVHRFDMHAVAAIKPVLADEGIINLETFDLAREMGWSGVALKTCKAHSAALLYVAKASECGMLYSVQDLTNPGLAFVHSAGLAACLTPLKGVEYNARQYLPWADPEVQEAHGDLFRVRGGRISTRTIGAWGLGYQMNEVEAAESRRNGTTW